MKLIGIIPCFPSEFLALYQFGSRVICIIAIESNNKKIYGRFSPIPFAPVALIFPPINFSNYHYYKPLMTTMWILKVHNIIHTEQTPAKVEFG